MIAADIPALFKIFKSLKDDIICIIFGYSIPRTDETTLK
jgi:hypothetical protein